VQSPIRYRYSFHTRRKARLTAGALNGDALRLDGTAADAVGRSDHSSLR
jgi:hypothetical protein